MNHHMMVQESPMPQPRKYASPAARQAAYHQRTQQARREQLSAKGLPTTPAIPTMPGYPRWRRAIEQAQSLVKMVHYEMEEYADQRSEQWQETDRAEILRQQIEDVSEAHGKLDELQL
jgi:hypothetical protein